MGPGGPCSPAPPPPHLPLLQEHREGEAGPGWGQGAVGWGGGSWWLRGGLEPSSVGVGRGVVGVVEGLLEVMAQNCGHRRARARVCICVRACVCVCVCVSFLNSFCHETRTFPLAHRRLLRPCLWLLGSPSPGVSAPPSLPSPCAGLSLLPGLGLPPATSWALPLSRPREGTALGKATKPSAVAEST